MEFNPFEFLIHFLLFTLGLRAIYPLCSLLHELGHAIPALLFTNDEVRIQSGIGEATLFFRIGRLKVTPIFSPAYNGFCDFSTTDLNHKKLALITLCGPILSGIFAALSLMCLVNPWLEPIVRGIAAIFFYANFRIFLTSMIPAYHASPRNTPEGPSDGLLFLQYMKGLVER
jgi:hypothetical protein